MSENIVNIPSGGTKHQALKVNNLYVRRDGHEVLRGVSLEISAGEILGLLGPNGAGKSTTIEAVTGLLPLAGGRVTLFGQSVRGNEMNVYRMLGILPENGGFYEWMTAQAYLTFFAKLYGADASEFRMDALLDMVQLRPEPRQAIAAFSRGMKQRLGLARALIGDPHLLILDEPTNGLDPRGRREVHDILLDLSRQGVAVLMSTHILDDVERLCHSISIISDGCTVANGRVSELMAQRGHGDRFEFVLGEPRNREQLKTGLPTGVMLEGLDESRVLLRINTENDLPLIWSGLIAAGWPIIEIRRVGSGLEDYYLSATEAGEKPNEQKGDTA